MSRYNCGDAIAQMYYYLDDEITRKKRARIERHVRGCAGCTGAYRFESHLKVVVRERLREEPPPEVIDRLWTFLRDSEDGFGG